MLLLKLALSLLLVRWFVEPDVAFGWASDSRGTEGFQPNNGCSPGLILFSLPPFFRERSMSDVVAEYECRGWVAHGMARLSREEKNPCWLILCPICDLGIPSFELTMSERIWNPWMMNSNVWKGVACDMQVDGHPFRNWPIKLCRLKDLNSSSQVLFTLSKSVLILSFNGGEKWIAASPWVNLIWSNLFWCELVKDVISASVKYRSFEFFMPSLSSIFDEVVTFHFPEGKSEKRERRTKENKRKVNDWASQSLGVFSVQIIQPINLINLSILFVDFNDAPQSHSSIDH